MSNVIIRDSCPYKRYNQKKGRSCMEDDPCIQCCMTRDIEENKELYQAMAVNMEDSNDE